MVVQSLMADHGMSQRRACSASGIARSTLRYRPVPRDDSGVIAFIQSHMALNPRHGFDLLYDSARHQKQPWGKTVLWRVYCQLRLNLPRAARNGCQRASSNRCKLRANPIKAGVATSCPTPCGQVGASGRST